MKARVLCPWEELVGKLLDVDICDDQETVVLNVSGLNYVLPSFPKELNSKLIKGTVIGILRTENSYAMRIVKGTPDARVVEEARHLVKREFYV